MVTYQLSEMLFEEDFGLIAIRTPLEGYRLVYFLNKYLEVTFHKDNENTRAAEQGFAHYLWQDKESENQWRCIANKMIVEEPLNGNGLFETLPKSLFFMEELKQADFLLKIENDPYGSTTAELVKKIADIPMISSVYQINTETLNSKNKLIF